MKARTKTTRWLAIAFLFGLIATAGLTLAHRGAPSLSKATESAAPVRTVLQLPHLAPALIASTGGPDALTPRAHRFVGSSYTNSQAATAAALRSDSQSDAPTGNTAWSNHATDLTGDSNGAPQPQSHPAASGTEPMPQPGAGEVASEIYAPLGCELPAGCGAVGSSGYVTRQTSGTSGGLPAVHDSQGSSAGNGDAGPTPNDGSPQTNDSGQNPPYQDSRGGGSSPPGKGSDPPAVSAPELDPTTLAGPLTLLLGALAILRGRRPARVKR